MLVSQCDPVFNVKTHIKRSPTNILTNLLCNYGYLHDFQVKLPKVNNGPNGENSPNLVTLLVKRNIPSVLKRTVERIVKLFEVIFAVF
jgi:hypothetical protein